MCAALVSRAGYKKASHIQHFSIFRMKAYKTMKLLLSGNDTRWLKSKLVSSQTVSLVPIKIIQSLKIIYIIPVRYATKVTPFCYRNAKSTSDAGTIQYHKVQDASAQ